MGMLHDTTWANVSNHMTKVTPVPTGKRELKRGWIKGVIHFAHNEHFVLKNGSKRLKKKIWGYTLCAKVFYAITFLSIVQFKPREMLMDIWLFFHGLGQYES